MWELTVKNLSNGKLSVTAYDNSLIAFMIIDIMRSAENMLKYTLKYIGGNEK